MKVVTITAQGEVRSGVVWNRVVVHEYGENGCVV